MTDMPDDFAHELRQSVAELLARHPAGVDVAALTDFGWPDLYAEDPRLAAGVLFGEAGRSVARVAAFEALVLQELGDFVPAGAQVAVLWPDPAGGNAAIGQTGGVTGTVLTGWREFDHLIVLDAAAEAVTLLAADGSRRVAFHGIDPAAGACRVAIAGDVVVTAEREVARAVLIAARRALAILQCAIGHEMLRVAVEHVSSRVQFGRPIGANQSVQHRLAEVHSALKAAAAAVDVSWQDGGALAGEVAAALSATAATTCIRHTLQVCGGMGFTEEFALAPLVRRSLLLAEIFDEAALTERIGLQAASVVRGGGQLVRMGSFSETAPQPV